MYTYSDIDQYKNWGEAEVFILVDISRYTRGPLLLYLYLSMRKLKSKMEWI